LGNQSIDLEPQRPDRGRMSSSPMEAETQSAVVKPDRGQIRADAIPPASPIHPASALTPAARLDFAARERPLRVGLVRGLGYRNLQGDLERTSRYLNTRNGIPHRVVKNQEETGKALDEFIDSGVDIVAVSGGDGTISMVATHLLNRSSEVPPPVVAVFQGGRTNMTAGDVGIRGNQVKNLRRLMDWAASPVVSPSLLTERRVIAIGEPGGPKRCGFFVGGGAVYHGSLRTWRVRDASPLPFMRGGLGTAASIARLVTAHLVSRSAFPASQMELLIDGDQVEENRWCALIATTLNRMALGIQPFWASGEGPIRLSAIAQEHHKLIRAGTKGLWGRAGGSLSRENGYHSFDAQQVEIGLDTGVTLDGEIIEPKNGKLVMSSPWTLTFLRI